MTVNRQRIGYDATLLGNTAHIVVTRDFALSALVRKSISDGEFFDFVQREKRVLNFLAERKLKISGANPTEVRLDGNDLAPQQRR